MIQPQSVSMEIGTTMDIFTTVVSLAGGEVPEDRIVHDVDLSDILFEMDGGKSVKGKDDHNKPPRDTFFYYPDLPTPRIGLYAVRYKNYKAHYITKGSSQMGDYRPDKSCRKTTEQTYHSPPILYDLNIDPSEQYPLDVSLPSNIELLAIIDELVVEHKNTLTWSNEQAQLNMGSKNENQPCCDKGCTDFPECCQYG